METFHVIIICFVVGAFIYSIFFNEKAVVKRTLKRAKLVSVSRFKEGQRAKLIGIAQPIADTLLTAPLSGRQCCYYHVVVEQERSSGRSSSWHSLVDEEDWVDYVINDNGYYAYINSEKIKSHIVRDREYSSGFLNDATPELKEFLKKYGHDSESWLGLNKTIRYYEGIIEPGERLALLGRGNWVDPKDIGLPAKYGQILSVTHDDAKKVIYMSDDENCTSLQQ